MSNWDTIPICEAQVAWLAMDRGEWKEAADHLKLALDTIDTQCSAASRRHRPDRRFVQYPNQGDAEAAFASHAPVIGLGRITGAVPGVAAAFEYDIEAALDEPDGP